MSGSHSHCQATTLASPKSLGQDQDAQYSKHTYRPSDLTWFHRGSAWGLSHHPARTVQSPARLGPTKVSRAASLAPILRPTKTMSSEDDLRHWLAQSAPGPRNHSYASSAGLSVPNWPTSRDQGRIRSSHGREERNMSENFCSALLYTQKHPDPPKPKCTELIVFRRTFSLSPLESNIYILNLPTQWIDYPLPRGKSVKDHFPD